MSEDKFCTKDSWLKRPCLDLCLSKTPSVLAFQSQGVDKDANDYKAKEATVPLWPVGSAIQIVSYMGLCLMQRTNFRIKCTDTMEGRGQLSGRGCGCLLALHQPKNLRMVAVQTQFFAPTSSYQLARTWWLSFLRILMRLPHNRFGTFVASSPWDDQRPFLGCNCTLSPRVT